MSGGTPGNFAHTEHAPWMPTRPTPATLVPGYRDFVLIARSDSSEVYRARQDGVDRPVAINVLQLDDREAIARFEREVSITVTIGRQHPNIVTVIETGITATGRPCIVMEYYDHGSLQDRLRAQGPLPWEEVLAAGTVVADALSFAHQHGVLHRDVKPQNILALPTSYVVADFGIARPIDAGHTSSAEWFSFHHASPETLDGERPTVTDDVWSVGSTMFTLLDGRPPFATDNADEDTALAYMKRVRTGVPRRLSRADVPPALVDVIDRCLRRDRSERWPNAASLHRALLALTGQVREWAPPPRPDGACPPPPRPDGAGPPPPAPPGAGPVLVSQQPQVVTVRPTHPQPTPAGGSSNRTGSAATGTRAAGATMPGVMPPSAMANLVASAVAASGYPTGSTTGTGTYPTTGNAPAPPAARPARRIVRVALIAVVTVLIGALVGVGGTMVAQLGRSDRGGDGVSAASPPATQDAATATAAPTGSPNLNHPEIAPTLVAVTQDGTSVLVQWEDPTGGQAQFIVVRVIDGTGEAVRALPAGTTQVVLDGLDPAAGPHCFLVFGVVGTDRGVSPTRCTEP